MFDYIPFVISITTFSYRHVCAPHNTLSLSKVGDIPGGRLRPLMHVLSHATLYWLFRAFDLPLFGEFSFYRQKKVADYDYNSLIAEKNYFHILKFYFLCLFPQTWGLRNKYN